MKTILRTIIFAPIIAVTLISCHKDLVVIQKGTVTAQEAWLTPEDAEANMYGMIDKLRVAFYNRLVHWGEYRAGIWEPGLTNNIEILNIFDNTISSANPHTDWTEIYSALNIANTVLKYAPTVDYTGQEAVMNRVIGSAYFTRAFCNYWIVRIWGDAPLQTIAIETTDPDILYPQRASKADIYAQVAADLESAAEHLKGTDIAPNMPNLNAVNTLKADLYLWLYKVEKDSSALAKARAAVNDVIGKRVLLENYADIFNVNNKNNDEEIFLWSMVKDELEGGYAQKWLPTKQMCKPEYYENPIPVGSSSQNQVITKEYQELLYSDPSDTRAKVTFDSFTDADNTMFVWCNKFLGTWENNDRRFDSDIIVYRYADVLLFNAEIYLAEGNTDAAIEQINKIAQRAYGKANYYEKGQSAEKVKEIILNERIKEFTGEGKLWWDYIRMDVVFDKVSKLKGKQNNKNILLWPLSNDSLNGNPKLQQTEIEY